MKIKIIIVVLIIILINGCAPWQLVSRESRWRYEKIEATLPEGWMRFNSPSNILFLTKDGELIETIRIFRYRIGKEKELIISKKKFTDGMLTQEISELITNEMSLDTARLNFKVSENIPVIIDGKDGFKIAYNYSTPDNLKLKAILYGFKLGKYIYLIQYQAAEQHYFEKELEVFNKFINNFKIL